MFLRIVFLISWLLSVNVVTAMQCQCTCTSPDNPKETYVATMNNNTFAFNAVKMEAAIALNRTEMVKHRKDKTIKAELSDKTVYQAKKNSPKQNAKHQQYQLNSVWDVIGNQTNKKIYLQKMVKIMASKNSNFLANMIVDVNGHESRKYEDFNEVYPVGGREETGGYKRFELAMVVDILSGVLSGAEFGTNCKGAGNLGLGFIVIDPNQFEDGFTNRMQSLIDACRNQPPADVGRPVLVPGDPERQHMELCNKLGGIPYTKNHIQISDNTNNCF